MPYSSSIGPGQLVSSGSLTNEFVGPKEVKES